MYLTVKHWEKVFQVVVCLFLVGVIAPNASAQLVKKLELGEFHSISLNSNYRVILRQSNKQEVEVRVEEEIWNATTIWVDNGVLHIDIKRDDSKKSLWAKIDNIKIRPDMDVNIAIPSVNKISVNGNGIVEAENSISSDNLVLEMNGNGTMDIDTRAKNVTASVFSPGEIKLSGYCDKLDLTVGGEGKFSGYEFDVKNASVETRGESTAEVSVSEKLDAEIYGNGNIHVKGKINVSPKIYGGGKLHRAY